MKYDCLIVDDEEMLANSTKDYFNLFEVKTYSVNSYKECMEFLKENAYKGISPRDVLRYLDTGNLYYLNDIACRQEKINAYYNEWIECYLLKHGPTYKQDRIDEELVKNSFEYKDEQGNIYTFSRTLRLIDKK